MHRDCKKIWRECLALIKEKVSPESYKTWFVPIKPYKYKEQVLTIAVPNQFFYEWLEGHYIDLLRVVIHEKLGPQGQLAYQVIASNGQLNAEDAIGRNKKPVETALNLNAKFTFERFIVGDCNQLAHSAAKNISQKPGETPFNPFMVYGGIGLGKTHLVQAIAHATQAQFPEKKINYITTEKFTAHFIRKIRENKVQEFINYYVNFDLLIVDDIQFLAGKEKTQEIFFHVFNHLYQSGKQIIMTSDCPPCDLQGFEKRLLSRFRCGLTLDLKKPNLETRIAISQENLEEMKLQLQDDLIHYIAMNVTSNIRELIGVLISLIAHADFEKKPIDKLLIKQVIDNVVGKATPAPEINLNYLQKIVTSYFKISLESLKKKSRKRELVVPRQLIMHLARKYTRHSLKAIGNIFGHKDHSTVSYGIKVVRNAIETSKEFRKQVNEIEATITPKVT